MDKLEKALEKARHMRTETTAPQPEISMPRTETTFQRDEALLARNRIVAHVPNTPEADTFRMLRTQVLQQMDKLGFKTLAITSPHYGDGKTTIATNLALSITMDIKQTVLLADLDLRKPSLHTALGLNATTGLTDHLLRQVPLADCLVRPAFDRLSILPAGSGLSNSSEILGSPQMKALAKEMRTRYPDRLIIYDMPPLLDQDDAIAFLPNVDAVLLVVQDGMTRVDDLKRSLEITASTPVLGTVLNTASKEMTQGVFFKTQAK